METKILFIAATWDNFLIQSQIRNLRTAGFDVDFSSTAISELKDSIYKKEYDFFIVALEDLFTEISSVCRALSRLIDGIENKHFFIIGTKPEVQNALNVSKNTLNIDCAFERPVNEEEVIKKIREISIGYSIAEDLKDYKLNSKLKTLLVVDDEAMQLEAMRRWFQKGYNVLTASSGSDALNLLKKYKVDLMLLDYEMPILSGLDTFKLIKAEPAIANVPVVFLTGNDDMPIVKEIISNKPAGYILKATPPMIIMRKVSDILSQLSQNK